jgi:hypothetical protein
VIEEAAASVEVNILELSLADELVRNLALEVHEQLQHVIVRLTGKHDFSWKKKMVGKQYRKTKL